MEKYTLTDKLYRFLKKAKQKYGDFYDYSMVEYRNDKTNIKIICPIHGEFLQQPRVHLSSKYGCRKCYEEERYLPFEDFLERVYKIHGDKYEYKKGNYKKSSDKIECFCKEHGEFFTKVNNLLIGKGCPKCGYETVKKLKTYTKEDFIKKAKEKHKNYYDYNKVIYKNSKEKVIITCKIHGDFSQIPSNHLYGQGCPYCSKNKSVIETIEDFIKECDIVHNGRYLYDKAVFEGLSKNIKIYCKKHGYFSQKARAHISGAGCRKCASDRINKLNRSTIEEFIRRAHETHKDKYDYSKTEYERCNKKVIIICKKHGEFVQTPEHHIRGSGCPHCANEKYKGYGGSSELKYLAEKLRTRVRIFVKKSNINKKHNTHEIIGCSWVELQEHLENNPYGFKIGQKGIDLDHIIPLSTCETEEDLIKLNHYTNLQLLPRKYNQHIKRDNPWDKEHFEKWYNINLKHKINASKK